jgi:hypothetical protein
VAIVLVEQVGAHGDTQQQSCNFQTYVFRIIAVLSTKTGMIITWPAISIPETYMSLGVSTKCISGYLGPGIIIGTSNDTLLVTPPARTKKRNGLKQRLGNPLPGWLLLSACFKQL